MGLAIAAGAQIASLMDHVDLDGNLLLAEDPVAGRRVPRRRAAPGSNRDSVSEKRYLVLAEEGRGTRTGKTARASVLRYGREPVVAILDSTHAGETYESIPVVAA